MLYALLDTGCERSVIESSLVKPEDVRRQSLSLYAANGTQIPVVGEATLHFQVGNKDFEAEVLVTEAVQGLILGIDWL
jgi:hypothetical protein